MYFLTSSSWNVNINLPDNDGSFTPLHLAVISGNARVVRRLLIKGASTTSLVNYSFECFNWMVFKDKNLKKASDLAKDNDFGNILEMIVSDFFNFLGKIE